MGTTKLNLTKEHKTYYTAKTSPEIVDFGEAWFLAKNLKVRYFLLFIGLVGLILVIWNFPVQAQDISKTDDKHFFWLNGGLGIGLCDDWPGIAYGTTFSYKTKNNKFFSIRHVASGEIDIFIPIPYGYAYRPSPLERVWDIGVLYGGITKRTYGFASVSGGISLVGGISRGRYLEPYNKYEKLTFLTVGIPIEAQLFWTPLSFIGIGLYGFGDLNLKKPFGGALLCLQIGKLR